MRFAPNAWTKLRIRATYPKTDVFVVVTESEYIKKLEAQWPQGPMASREVLSLACLAVRDFPNSAMLWFLRGRLIAMSPPDYLFSKLDAITSFQKAIELDPTFADAREYLRRYHDCSRSDLERDASKLKNQNLD